MAYYNQRGTAEQHIKEGKNAIRWTRLSCQKFRNNEVRLQLHALAYNLGNFMRTLALPKAVEQWSLTTLREKLVKIGAKVVRHGRYVTFQLAEVAIPRDLFADILRRIDRLRTETGPNMKVEPANMQPLHGIAVPGARREQWYPTLRRPTSAPTQRIGGMHAPRAPACCQPGGIGARSTLLKELKWGIPADSSAQGLSA